MPFYASSSRLLPLSSFSTPPQRIPQSPTFPSKQHTEFICPMDSDSIKTKQETCCTVFNTFIRRSITFNFKLHTSRKASFNRCTDVCDHTYLRIANRHKHYTCLHTNENPHTYTHTLTQAYVVQRVEERRFIVR